MLTACSSSKQSANVEGKTTSSIIADGATLQLISKQFAFTEGPAVDKNGNVFFTDQPNDKIWRYGTDGNLTVFLDKTGRSNGLYFDDKGYLVACADANNELWRIDETGAHTVLVKNFNGKRLNGPNDLWIHPNGSIYFTDPLYKRDYWTNTPDVEGQLVYYLAKGATQPIVVASTLQKPNGIVGTADGKTLYVADIQGKKTYQFTINADGTLGEPSVFTEQGSDGLTIDNQGNLYLTGDGVTVYNSAGQKIEHIPVPAKWTANVCFGGKKRNKLFITASDAVYIVDTKVKGVN